MANEKVHADTPWWSNLISVFVALIVGAVIGRNLMPVSVSTDTGGLSLYFQDLFMYLPYSLMLFGILADMFTYEGVYSIPTLLSIVSLAVNGLWSYLWTGLFGMYAEVTSAINTPALRPTETNPGTAMFTGTNQQGGSSGFDGCSIPGLPAFMSSSYVPQTLLVTSTIFWYYILDLILNRGFVDATASILMFVVLYAGQFAFIRTCLASGDISPMMKALFAQVQGLTMGAIGYGVIATQFPVRLPTAALPVGRRVDPRSLSMRDGKMVDTSGTPFVQLNGQWIPDIGSPEGRAAAGLTTGPAVPSASCGK